MTQNGRRNGVERPDNLGSVEIEASFIHNLRRPSETVCVRQQGRIRSYSCLLMAWAMGLAPVPDKEHEVDEIGRQHGAAERPDQRIAHPAMCRHSCDHGADAAVT